MTYQATAFSRLMAGNVSILFGCPALKKDRRRKKMGYLS